MSTDTNPAVKVPISKAKFYGYQTAQERKALEGTKNSGPKLLRTLNVTPDARVVELSALAHFFMEMGEEEIISHVLVTKNTLNNVSV